MLRTIISIWRDFSSQMKKQNISAYASSTAFFLFLSVIPMLMVVCAVIPYTPVTEQNLVGSKAVMKGTANLQLTYLDEQNELRTLSLAGPFSQYCQLQGDYEQNEDVETALLVTGVQLEPEVRIW